MKNVLKYFAFGILTMASVSEAQLLSNGDKTFIRECALRLEIAARSNPSDPQNVHLLSVISKECRLHLSFLLDTLFDLALGLLDGNISIPSPFWTVDSEREVIIDSLCEYGLKPGYAEKFLATLISLGNKADEETGWTPAKIFTFAYQLTAIAELLRETLDFCMLDTLSFSELACMVNENYDTNGGCVPGIINRFFKYILQALSQIANIEEDVIALEDLLSFIS